MYFNCFKCKCKYVENPMSKDGIAATCDLKQACVAVIPAIPALDIGFSNISVYWQI